MSDYTLETTIEDFELDRITIKEFILIYDLLLAEAEKNQKEDELYKHFFNKTKKLLRRAKTLENIKEIKEGLRIMPSCVGKTLIFRAIIMKEDQIKDKL